MLATLWQLLTAMKGSIKTSASSMLKIAKRNFKSCVAFIHSAFEILKYSSLIVLRYLRPKTYFLVLITTTNEWYLPYSPPFHKSEIAISESKNSHLQSFLRTYTNCIQIFSLLAISSIFNCFDSAQTTNSSKYKTAMPIMPLANDTISPLLALPLCGCLDKLQPLPHLRIHNHSIKLLEITDVPGSCHTGIPHMSGEFRYFVTPPTLPPRTLLPLISALHGPCNEIIFVQFQCACAFMLRCNKLHLARNGSSMLCSTLQTAIIH